MVKRFGSTSIATILAIGGLLAVGVGGFAAYRSYTGGCGSCCGHKDAAITTPVVHVEEGHACAGGCSAEAKAACAESEACCQGKPADECCKGSCSSEKSACEGEKACGTEKTSCGEKAHEGCSGEAGEPTAAVEKKSCPLCPSKGNG